MAENPKISIAEIAEAIGLSIKGVEKISGNLKQMEQLPEPLIPKMANR
jgi:hypothetical protein